MDIRRHLVWEKDQILKDESQCWYSVDWFGGTVFSVSVMSHKKDTLVSRQISTFVWPHDSIPSMEEAELFVKEWFHKLERRL